MAYWCWHAGLHIQQEIMTCIALQKTRHGWALRKWWQYEMDDGTTDVQRLAILLQWRHEMPRIHKLAIALPATGTLQKQLPIPRLPLREHEQQMWIATTLAKQLEMPAETLSFDYDQQDSTSYSVTTAKHAEVETLLKLTKAAKIKVCAVIPDACALQHFFSWLPDKCRGLRWYDGHRWIWATRDTWGYGAEAESDFTVCCNNASHELAFNPWGCIRQLQPPLPENTNNFTVALALALAVGEY